MQSLCADHRDFRALSVSALHVCRPCLDWLTLLLIAGKSSFFGNAFAYSASYIYMRSFAARSWRTVTGSSLCR